MSFLQPCASFSNLWKRQTNNRKATHKLEHQTEHSARYRPQTKPQTRGAGLKMQALQLLTLSHNEQLTSLNPHPF